MKKLTIKELAPYLPFGLKWMPIIVNRYHLNDYWDYIREGHKTEMGLFQVEKILECILNDPNDPHKRAIHAKPILRPLSDLTKEIEVNGEKFVPNKFLCDKSKLAIGCHIRNWNSNVNSIESMPVYDYNKLLEWHFDVFSLIEDGLAIDINTLQNER